MGGLVGATEGCEVGTWVGNTVGFAEENSLGSDDGYGAGLLVRMLDEKAVGAGFGYDVGYGVGQGVGGL